MSSDLLKKVRAKRNLESAWRVIEENARTSKSEHVRSEIETFKEDVTGNLERLYRGLLRGTFEFEPAKGIAIPKSKPGGGKRGDIRPIVLATVEARIVQRAILNVLTELPQFAHCVDSPNSFGGMRKSEQRSLSAVPAAINAVLQAIGDGAYFVVCADISGFFTRISKSAASTLIAEKIDDQEFMAFFDSAIRVELANLAQLREFANKFPIEDLGVAQGNSLSPFLGNILLHDFDQAMNAGDCDCKRYIDDFIILAPSSAAASARLRMAKRLLADHGMELSAGKSHESPIDVRQRAFEFLGIELTNGLLRPARKAQEKLLANVRAEFDKSAKAFDTYRRDGRLESDLSLVATLRRVDGMVQGWGKHYRFCNDEKCFARIDELVDELLASYLGRYASARERGPQEGRRKLLGVRRLDQIERQPFRWPKLLSKVAA
jgi:RNA-directed DNA polymerase